MVISEVIKVQVMIRFRYDWKKNGVEKRPG
jgi:hypothetical protein